MMEEILSTLKSNEGEDPSQVVEKLYNKFGQNKSIGTAAEDQTKPHYFLHRKFLGENDLLIIFNTKRCRYQCIFCELPTKSSTTFISGEKIILQFLYVMHELKHSLSVLDKLTFSNEGSVLDSDTMPHDVLFTIMHCVQKLRRVKTITLETRLEFVEPGIILKMKEIIPKKSIDILTGFETLDSYIRDNRLYKRESLKMFEEGLDNVAKSGTSLTSYVLYKSDPKMTDYEAFGEAERSIDYLKEQCEKRGIPLTIRLNPMYAAKGSVWSQIALSMSNYKPPRLTDIMRLAAKKSDSNHRIYIGLSTEGLDEHGGSYHSREDFSDDLIKQALLWNDNKISEFNFRNEHGTNNI